MAFKMKAGKEGPMKKNFGIGKNLPDGRSTSSAFQKEMPTDVKNLTRTNYKEDTKKKSGPDWSKAPKLNTQARRDWYTKNNLAQDATTKLKPASKTTTKPAAKPAAKTTTKVKSNLKPPTKLPTIKPKLTPTTSNLLGTISKSIKPKAKDETNIKLKKNKLTGGTKTKTVEKVGDKVIKTKNITDRKGNTKTKTKTRKRTAGKGKQKIAKTLTKFASKLLK